MKFSKLSKFIRKNVYELNTKFNISEYTANYLTKLVKIGKSHDLHYSTYMKEDT